MLLREPELMLTSEHSLCDKRKGVAPLRKPLWNEEETGSPHQVLLKLAGQSGTDQLKAGLNTQTLERSAVLKEVLKKSLHYNILSLTTVMPNRARHKNNSSGTLMFAEGYQL